MLNSLFNIRFDYKYENPEYFWLFLLLIPMIVWYVLKHKKSFAHIKTTGLHDYQSIPPSFMQYFIHVLFVLRLAALSFIIIAFARPISVDSYADSTTYGVDIVLAMDVSGSMLAQDLKPDRIEAAKDVAAKFVNSRPFDRMGLVVFSGESFTQCPLTSDHATLLNLLDELHSGMIEDGTAIGTGLGLSVTRLKESKAISKVIVLLTDGVNNRGDIDPLTAAELAQKYGIRIYTIGVGTRGDAPYPFQTVFGIQMQMVQVEIDEPMLNKVAEVTGGKYFRATNKQELLKIYETIDSLEKTKIEDFKYSKKKDEFMPFILIALILLALEFLLQQTICKRFP